MQQDLAGFAELSAGHGEDGVVQIDMFAVQGDRFARADTGCRQQGDDRLQGGGT